MATKSIASPAFAADGIHTHCRRTVVAVKCRCSLPECHKVIKPGEIMLELELADGSLAPFCGSGACKNRYKELSRNPMIDYSLELVTPTQYNVIKKGVASYSITWRGYEWRCDCPQSFHQRECKHESWFRSLELDVK